MSHFRRISSFSQNFTYSIITSIFPGKELRNLFKCRSSLFTFCGATYFIAHVSFGSSLQPFLYFQQLLFFRFGLATFLLFSSQKSFQIFRELFIFVKNHFFLFSVRIIFYCLLRTFFFYFISWYFSFR